MKLLWRAYYEDGTVTNEGDNDIRSPLKISKRGLTRFSLVDEQGVTKAEISLHDGQKLFYRTYGTRSAGGGPIRYRYAIGYRTPTETFFLGVDEQGNISEHTLFSGVWFEPTWFPEEIPTGS